MPPLDPSTIVIRSLEHREEYEACVALQRLIWGDDFADCVPATILMVTQRVGGVTAGAFDPTGRLLGFVYGISGVRDGRLVHWSDMLAVHADARALGLGRRLKLFQRDRLLERGIEVAYWTYDPLVARNAHLNLNVLGARVTEYVPHMYGDTGSQLHRGLDTDRFIVEWRLSDPAVAGVLRGERPPLAAEVATAPILSHGIDLDRSLPAGPWIRVEVPGDIEQVKAAFPDVARAWQALFRRVFLHYLNAGYRVVACSHGADRRRFFYVLTNAPLVATA